MLFRGTLTKKRSTNYVIFRIVDNFTHIIQPYKIVLLQQIIPLLTSYLQAFVDNLSLVLRYESC